MQTSQFNFGFRVKVEPSDKDSAWFVFWQRLLGIGGETRQILLMPTVLRFGPYRGFFYAGDRHEPPHIHIERDRNKAKYWLEPVALESSNGFSRGELMDIYRLISDQQVVLLEKWHEYFGD